MAVLIETPTRRQVVPVTALGMRADPATDPDAEVIVAMHVSCVRDELWVSVEKPTPGVVMKHGDVIADLTPVPMPLRAGSVAVNGSCHVRRSTVATAPGGFIEFDNRDQPPVQLPQPQGTSIRTAVILDCIAATAYGPQGAIDLVALAYTPHSADPLEDAVQRARKCASYGAAPSMPWNLLLVEGPRFSYTAVGSPALSARVEPAADAPAQSTETTETQAATTPHTNLRNGDAVVLHSATAFPGAPIIPTALVWSPLT